MDRMNKGGWLRIVEASISIIAILGVMFFLFMQASTKDLSPDYGELGRDILDEIAKDNALRDEILSVNLDDLTPRVELDENYASYVFVGSRVDASLSYSLVVCQIGGACGTDDYIDANEIYAEERIISADYDLYAPRKVRIFIWRKVQ